MTRYLRFANPEPPGKLTWHQLPVQPWTSTVSPVRIVPTTGYRVPGPPRTSRSACAVAGAAAAMPAESMRAAPLASKVFLMVLVMNETPFANSFRLGEQRRVRDDVPDVTQFQWCGGRPRQAANAAAGAGSATRRRQVAV